jgi:aminopeptidase N
MLRQFRRWAIAESEEGPISLGSRLGHIKNDRRVFRALVYNKGAAVLHMLRRLIGDEAFFSGVRRFYTEQKFKKSGTDDLRTAFEAASGKPLDRFFEQWIYGVQIPRFRYATTSQPGTVAVRFEQIGDVTFDVPVTVSIVYTNGRIRDVVVPVTDQRVEWTAPVDGPVKQVLVNRDYAAVAVFERF